MTRSLRTLIGAAALALIGACAGAGSGTTIVAAPLESTDWHLASVGAQPAIPTEGANAARLRFVADSQRVLGGGGCNMLSGSYTLAGDSLRLREVVSTRMACADERLNAQEVAFLQALDDTRRYRISGDTLTLVGDGGPVASLVASPGG